MLIALDIDGTITQDKLSVPQEVCAYLKELTEQGCKICVLTGRTYTFASKALSSFDFDYYFSAQNGSVLFEMPRQKELHRSYMDNAVIDIIDQAYQGYHLDYLVYAGYEEGDFCYYRKGKFSNEIHAYLKDLQTRQEVAWKEVDNFFAINSFPLIKGFGSYQAMKEIKEKLDQTGLFEIALNRDFFDDRFYLIQITNHFTSKGSSLEYLIKKLGVKVPVIAAGDDDNDISMFKVADVSIAIETAPAHVKEQANWIAESPKTFGIIKTLKKVLATLNG